MNMRSIAAMPPTESQPEAAPSTTPAYRLAEQIQHRLRRAHQRASAIFQETVGEAQLTPTQWSVLATLSAEGPLSQNHLGRLTYMDPATTQGVILRLAERHLLERQPDPHDRRRTSVRLTRAGQTLVQRLRPDARLAHEHTLEPFSPEEKALFLNLLERLM